MIEVVRGETEQVVQVLLQVDQVVVQRPNQHVGSPVHLHDAVQLTLRVVKVDILPHSKLVGYFFQKLSLLVFLISFLIFTVKLLLIVKGHGFKVVGVINQMLDKKRLLNGTIMLHHSDAEDVQVRFVVHCKEEFALFVNDELGEDETEAGMWEAPQVSALAYVVNQVDALGVCNHDELLPVLVGGSDGLNILICAGIVDFSFFNQRKLHVAGTVQVFDHLCGAELLEVGGHFFPDGGAFVF